MTQPALTELIQQRLHALPSIQRIWVGFSGGADSTALLHAVMQLIKQQRNDQFVGAIHVNHGLSDHAQAWQEHCQKLAEQWGVSEFVARQIEVDEKLGGLEKAARDARYQVFADVVGAGDLLLLGHHQQDQVETFFLRLARGAGAKGLVAMTPQRAFGAAWIARPFLDQTKEDLLAYLNAQKITWIEDESNLNERFDRNFLRSNVLPKLSERWPHFNQQVLRSTKLLTEQDSLLSEYLTEDFARVNYQQERVGVSINLEALKLLSPVRRKNLVRFWLQKLGYSMPTAKQLEQCEQFYLSKSDAQPLLAFGECELRRFKNRLFCLRQNWQQNMLSTPEPLANYLADKNDKSLIQLNSLKNAEGFIPGPADNLTTINLALSFKRGHPSGRQHSQTIKKLFQEYAVEPWLRPFWPMVVRDEKLVAVVGLWVERSFYSPNQGVFLDWSAAS